MKKYLKSIVALLLSVGIIFCGNVTFFAKTETDMEKLITIADKISDEGYTVLKLTKDDINNQRSFEYALQSLLNRAYDEASEENQYKIKVPKGNYKISRALTIYSNTFLDLSDCNISRSASAGINLLRIGDHSDYEQGYYYKNITVFGGCFDGDYGSNTCIRAEHAENVNFINMTVKNTRDGHLMEIAGVKNITLNGCVFKNQLLSKGGDSKPYEAVQFDILVDSHLNNCVPEDLNSTDITVKNCGFDNVPRGVGSHTAIYNHWVKKVTVTGCVFRNIPGAAIQAQGWLDVNISKNNIISAARGISLYYMKETAGTFLPSVIAKKSNLPAVASDKFITPASNMKIKVSNNTINCTLKDPYADYDATGIYLGGENITKSSGGIPAGNYYMSGAEVTGNVITDAKIGIRASNLRKATIKKNTCKGKKTGDPDRTHGIHITKASQSIKVISNNISKSGGSGISENYNCKSVTMESNIITSPAKYGVFVYDSKADSISSNTIKSSAINAIFILNKGKVDKISSNNIDTAGKYGISIDNAVAKKISDNKITSVATIGIASVNNGTVSSISGNSVTKGKTAGIAVYTLKNKITLSKNTVKSCGNNIPYVVQGKYEVVLENQICNVSGTLYKPDSIKSASAKKSGASKVKISWSKVKGSDSYAVYRSTKKSTGFVQVNNVKGNSCTDKPVERKTYYYKVAAVKKVSGKKVTIYSAPSKTLKVDFK